MLFVTVVEASAAVAATSSRNAKVAVVAELLALAEPAEVDIVAHYLAGRLRQRRTGIGWRSLTGFRAAEVPGLSVGEVDAALEHLASLSGPGSQSARLTGLAELMGRATEAEQHFLGGLIVGENRQGAQEGILVQAIGRAFDVPIAVVRRAAMLGGSIPETARAASEGGADALASVGLEVGRPVLPMLASSAPTVAGAFAKLIPGSASPAGAPARPDDKPPTVDALKASGEEPSSGPAPTVTRACPSGEPLAPSRGDIRMAVEAKLDGIRIQAHKRADAVSVYSRSLDDITARLPEVVAIVAALPCRTCVLDGEALTLDADGRPRPFQETAALSASSPVGARVTPSSGGADDPDGTARSTSTASAQASDASETAENASGLTPAFFDILELDGVDLIDAPTKVRHERLARLVPERHRVGRLVTADADAAERFARDVLAAGHEGVVIKALDLPYEAGRRGAGWIKVKPVHTLDLVVLAVEHGSGRRRGRLSNIHLGARDPATGGFVMLGKTFKGMTDEMLAWQTARFEELKTSDDGWVVTVRPEQVVEIAFDGVQRSPRYPGGVALRFARVLRYRDDRTPAEADTLDAVRAYVA